MRNGFGFRLLVLKGDIMKKTVFLLGLLLVPAVAFAGTNLGFEWDFGTAQAPGDLSHFRLEQAEETESGTWSDWHIVVDMIPSNVRAHTVEGLADGTYRFRIWAVDNEDPPLSSQSNIVERYVEDPSGPPPIPHLRIISEIIVEIKNGNIVAQKANSRIERLSFPVD
jgi:hypothetical protein